MIDYVLVESSKPTLKLEGYLKYLQRDLAAARGRREVRLLDFVPAELRRKLPGVEYRLDIGRKSGGTLE